MFRSSILRAATFVFALCAGFGLVGNAIAAESTMATSHQHATKAAPYDGWDFVISANDIHH